MGKPPHSRKLGVILVCGGNRETIADNAVEMPVEVIVREVGDGGDGGGLTKRFRERGDGVAVEANGMRGARLQSLAGVQFEQFGKSHLGAFLLRLN